MLKSSKSGSMAIACWREKGSIIHALTGEQVTGLVWDCGVVWCRSLLFCVSILATRLVERLAADKNEEKRRSG